MWGWGWWVVASNRVIIFPNIFPREKIGRELLMLPHDPLKIPENFWLAKLKEKMEGAVIN